MVVKIGGSIISPLGNSVDSVYEALARGESSLRSRKLWNLEEPFVGSMMNWEEEGPDDGLTRFESLSLRSALAALQEAGIDGKRDDVAFVFSTTKGNIEQLGHKFDTTRTQVRHKFERRLNLGEGARRVVRELGNGNDPVVVSNACTSGLCAQIVAQRMLEQKSCRYAVVVGCDVLTEFIVSGFQSFKALSPEGCRPFDAERKGLNLGEAAAAMVLTLSDEASGRWVLERGAIRNDANHISGPSRTGEGSYRALRAVLAGVGMEGLAFVNAHGTATMYNDEMESIALERAGITDVPVNSLKGYLGHTMGAAGVLECLVSMKAVEEGVVLATRGFEKKGVSGNIKINGELTTTDRPSFVKMLSGFGGCNAVMLYRKGGKV